MYQKAKHYLGTTPSQPHDNDNAQHLPTPAVLIAARHRTHCYSPPPAVAYPSVVPQQRAVRALETSAPHSTPSTNSSRTFSLDIRPTTACAPLDTRRTAHAHYCAHSYPATSASTPTTSPSCAGRPPHRVRRSSLLALSGRQRISRNLNARLDMT